LPAADAEGRVALAEHLRRGPACETLRAGGIALLGIVIASPERARQYFRHFPPCCPIAAAPDREIHRAYGLPEVVRTPEFRQETARRAAAVLGERARHLTNDQALAVFMTADGFETTAEDEAEMQRPLQSMAYFLIAPDRSIRWVLVDPRIVPLPPLEDLLSLV
jgi:hypothetical protein